MKYLITFVLSIIVDFIVSWNGYAVAHDQVLLSAVIGFFVPFFNLFCIIFFIEEKTFIGRLKLTFCVAVAQSIGSTIMLMTVAK